ncbi:MAG: hypothetical protein WC254_05305 [Candidatus Woesearchaeota archaeon]|jgi:hypothetical protein
MKYQKLSPEQGVRIRNSIKSQKKNLYEVAKEIGAWDPSKLSRVLKGRTGIYENEAQQLYEIVNDSSLSFLIENALPPPEGTERRDGIWKTLYEDTQTELGRTYLKSQNITRALIISELEKIIEKYKIEENQ